MTDPSGVNIDWEKIEQRKRLGVANGLLMVQLVLSRLVRSQLSKPGTGRVYRVAVGKIRGRNLRAQGLHRASAPGNPPAVDTGRLRQSWAIGGNADQMFSVRVPLGAKKIQSGQALAVITSEIGQTRMRFTYGSNLKYARALEFGVPARRLAQRPYVRPVVAAVTPRAAGILQLEVKKAMAQP